jgi:MFS family permease
MLMARAYLLAFCLSLGVTVSNSFARFAYALVLPAMRTELSWTYAQAGWLNTANAIGYLAGAVLTRLVIRATGNRGLFIGGVLVTGLAILATGMTRDLAWLGAWRALSGVAGAAAFISGGALSGNIMPERPQVAATTIAIYFAGGGVGFLLCGVAVPLWLDAGGVGAWQQAWVGMGLAGLMMLAVCGWAAWRIAEPNLEPPGAPGGARAVHSGVRHLTAGLVTYVMFGLGYIGYMTFVIAWMRDHGASTLEVVAFWSVFGLASLAGPWLWRIPLTWMPGRMLAAAMGVLALGALLPLWSAAFASMLVSAVLFGASMWNIPGSVTNLAKRALPKPVWGAAVATFTMVFAAGQIVGPVTTGALADAFGSLRVGLGLSVGVLALGALIALAQRDIVYREAGLSGCSMNRSKP